MRRVLITGANGFIGKHLCKKLKWANFYRLGFFDKNGYSGYQSDEWEGIVHLAGLARVSDCEADPLQAVMDNVALTAEMLKKRPKWFIYAGTVTPNDCIYGKTKVWAEELAYFYAEKHKIGLRVFHFANVYGEGQNPSKLLPRAVAHFQHGEPFALSDSALPVEYVSLERVVEEIDQAMLDAHYFMGSITMPKKLCDGVLKTRKELMNWAENVAASHPQSA